MVAEVGRGEAGAARLELVGAVERVEVSHVLKVEIDAVGEGDLHCLRHELRRFLRIGDGRQASVVGPAAKRDLSSLWAVGVLTRHAYHLGDGDPARR